MQLLAMFKKICANQRSLLSIKIHLEGAELGSIGSIVCRYLGLGNLCTGISNFD